MPRVFDLTGGAKSDDRPEDTPPVLLQVQKRWSRNPFWYIWTAWEHAAYFVAPANQCVYCWLMRVFVIGAGIGAAGMWWYLKR